MDHIDHMIAGGKMPTLDVLLDMLLDRDENLVHDE